MMQYIKRCVRADLGGFFFGGGALVYGVGVVVVIFFLSLSPPPPSLSSSLWIIISMNEGITFSRGGGVYYVRAVLISGAGNSRIAL